MTAQIKDKIDHFSQLKFYAAYQIAKGYIWDQSWLQQADEAQLITKRLLQSVDNIDKRWPLGNCDATAGLQERLLAEVNIWII